MKNVVSIFILSLFLAGNVIAGPTHKHKGPSGYRGNPASLTQKGGLPLGIANKYFAGNYRPSNIYLPLKHWFFTGREWVRAGQAV